MPDFRLLQFADGDPRGDGPLHLVRLSLDAGRLFDLEKRLHLPPGGADLGYLVHCQLGTLFGDHAPSLFAIERSTRPDARSVGVLAYSALDGRALQAHAQAFADPRAWAACDWDTFASKPMPALVGGEPLGFEVRVSPVVRTHRPGPVGPRLDARGRPKVREVDAFLAACWEKEERGAADLSGPVDREFVYRRWVAEELARGGAAKANYEELRVVGLQRASLVRRTQGGERRARRLDRPDVQVEGTLHVATPTSFRALLARGLGRHRAFGFGMLLLRPAR
jgi:CRISPR system Cascade subunit CasE